MPSNAVIRHKRKLRSFLPAALATVLKQQRLKLGLSQEEMAERSHLHRTYICDVERGARNPSLVTLERLAEALEMSTAELIRRSEAIKRSFQDGGGRTVA